MAIVRLFTPTIDAPEIPSRSTRPIAVYTLVLYFWEKNGSKVWSKLTDREKGSWIDELVNFKTDVLKKISRSDLKLMDMFNGGPPRPWSTAWTVLVSGFNTNFTGKASNLLAESSKALRCVTAEIKTRYKSLTDQHYEDDQEDARVLEDEPARRAILEAQYKIPKLIKKPED